MTGQNLWAQGDEDTYGIVTVSVCNTRSDAEYSAGQESQAIMGMPVGILGRAAEGTKITTPDG